MIFGPTVAISVVGSPARSLLQLTLGCGRYILVSSSHLTSTVVTQRTTGKILQYEKNNILLASVGRCSFYIRVIQHTFVVSYYYYYYYYSSIFPRIRAQHRNYANLLAKYTFRLLFVVSIAGLLDGLMMES